MADPESEAWELSGNFINGNRSFVLDEIIMAADRSTAHAAYLAAAVSLQLFEYDGNNDYQPHVAAFFNLLKGRMPNV